MALFKKDDPEEPDPATQRRAEIADIMAKYREKLEGELGTPKEENSEESIASSEYQSFKAEYLPKHLNIYEKLCAFSEKLLKISPDPKKVPDYQETIEISNL